MMMRLAGVSASRALQQQLRLPVQGQQLLFSTRRSASAARAKQQQQLTRNILAAEFAKQNIRHGELIESLGAMRKQAAQHAANMEMLAAAATLSNAQHQSHAYVFCWWFMVGFAAPSIVTYTAKALF